MDKSITFYLVIFSLFYFSCFSQAKGDNNCFYINPFINSFIDNLISKDVNINKHYLTIIYLKDNSGDHIIEFELTSGYLKSLRNTTFKESSIKYGNIEVLLNGKTDEDLTFLKKSIRKTTAVFKNKDLSKDDHSFYDEDYVWISFFNDKGELKSLYIPEDKEPAFKIYDNLKNKIKISSDFKTLDFNSF